MARVTNLLRTKCTDSHGFHLGFLALGCVLLGSIACGRTEIVNPVGGEGGTGGTAVVAPIPAEISTISAPDRQSVRVVLSGDVGPDLGSSPAFVIGSERGPLEVTGVLWDPMTKILTLETAKQKLGVTYTLTIQSAEEPIDGLSGDFIAADTATFWANDFSDPGFPYYELTADRVAVSEHLVLYLEQGQSADDIEETIEQFETVIFPIETALYHEAPDRDDNGRIVLLGLDGELYYGGYFSPINAMTDKEAKVWGYHSNEMEMLYLNVAALMGYRPRQVVSHEFAHLLYNEQHSWQQEYWEYHNEGLAECAVHACYGINETAAAYYISDPDEELRNGKSLVFWDYANYIQYAQAYVFWTYLASKLGGVPGYRDLFLESGNPGAIDALLQQKLGINFATAQLNALAAAWVQAPTGPYGFDGMLTLDGMPATVPVGTMSVDLAPFAGVFFAQEQPEVTPVGAGANVFFLGFDGSGVVDPDAPFMAGGGVVIALNGRLDWFDPTPESSGVLTAAAQPLTKGQPHLKFDLAMDPTWLRAPPLPPGHEMLRAWRLRTSGL